MPARVAINGFGRIGRHFLRQSFGKSDFQVVAINDLGDLENLAYLLKYDTVYGRYDKEIKANVEANELVVGGQKIQVSQIKDPTQLPWKDLNIDIVVEATGVFAAFEKAKVHLDAGAKRVVITAPAKDQDGDQGRTVLMGVNNDKLETVQMSSNGSCTTNSASPIVQIMSESIGIEKAMLSTVHGYTATQSLVDGPARGKDMRRGRAAATNIVPSTTGAAIALARALPELENKFDGVAFRVPVPAGSIADITFLAKRNTTVEEVNDILREAAKAPKWQGIMKVVEDQVVSSDILKEPYGAVADLNYTKVVDGNLVKVLSWYDNEFGYVATLVKHVGVAALLV